MKIFDEEKRVGLEYTISYQAFAKILLKSEEKREQGLEMDLHIFSWLDCLYLDGKKNVLCFPLHFGDLQFFEHANEYQNMIVTLPVMNFYR